ncbi:MAG: T9SS type A sorting domain-containing protein [Saprospiraceae bacterium]|nr:T9SS type A sorting domain-containing protein [Saprospiraceae bacterium]
MAQEFYSKLLSKEVFAEFAHGIIEVDDSSNLLQFRSSTDLTFNFGWMHIHQNGDTLSTFLFKVNLVRPDGTNTILMSGDTVFQLLKHRDSIHQIRVYATSLGGDSLFMRNYDWARPDWRTVYPRVLYRSDNGEWLIIGGTVKANSEYDVFAILCNPDGSVLKQNVVIEDFDKVGSRVEYLYAHNIIENDSGYIFSLRDWYGDAFSSSHIIFIDKELDFKKRIDNAQDGLAYEYNPIGFTKDTSSIYFASSRILEFEEIEAAGYDWQEIQNPTMITGMLDIEGNLMWERIMYLPKGNWLEVYSGKTVSNGDFVVCGSWQKGIERLGLIARYSEQGNLIYCYGFPLHEAPNRSALWLVDFVEDNTGALTFVGDLEVSQSFNNKDIWLLRIPGYGCDPDFFDCSIDSVITSIKLIPEKENSAPGMTLYPNPIFPGQSINLELSGVSSGMANFRWIDLNGKILHQQDVEIYENAPSLQVPSQLKAGWYLVELRDSKGITATAKVVVWKRF